LPSVELVWGLIAAIAVLSILSVSIIAGVLLHSRKIKKAENRFRLLFNRVDDALIVFDKDEKIYKYNESTSRLLGYSKKYLMKSGLKNIILKDKWLELHDQFQKVLENNHEYRGETQLIDSDDNLIEVEVIGVSLDFGGEPYVLSNFRDITERKKNEMELKRKHITLQEVLGHLEEEKLKIKSQVTRTIEQVMMPTLNRISIEGNSNNKAYIEILKSSLEEMSSDSITILEAYDKLSPREIEICNMIKNGATSKEIAGTLNISVLTVNKHRERIRKKLVISNKSINLASFLKKL